MSDMHWKRRRPRWPYWVALGGLFLLTLAAPWSWHRTRSARLRAAADAKSHAPEAAFEAVPISGEAPLAVSFFNTSAGSVTTSQWDFGDGGTSTLLNPTHVYTKPGIYSVKLIVNGPVGSDEVTNTAYIRVGATVYRMLTPIIVRPR